MLINIKTRHFHMYKMLINIKTRHFHSSIYHQEQFFHRTLITGYFRLVNIAKFLGTGFFIEYLQKQLFADIPQNRYSKTSQEAFVLQSLFKKTCRLKACNCLQLHKKRLQHRCFPVKFASYRAPLVTASAPQVPASVFFF